MATRYKNLSFYDPSTIPSARGMRFVLLVSEWNKEITSSLLEAAVTTLEKHGADAEEQLIEYVPGSFELPLAASWYARQAGIDGVICLGCIIQGETRHFEFISAAVAQGIMSVNLETSKPVVFGVLTTDNLDQARERSGGRHGNKGTEAAIAGIKMVSMHQQLIQSKG